MKPNPNWPYLAGLVDGEGCLTITRQRNVNGNRDEVPYHYKTTINIAMTSERIMKWLVSEVGGVYYHRHSDSPKWKDAYCWHPSGHNNVERFLLGILPYLVIKHEQARLLLEFVRLPYKSKQPKVRQQLWEQCRILNQRGASLETNTLSADGTEPPVMIESDLTGDRESALPVMATA